jgi:hypothetical protein
MVATMTLQQPLYSSGLAVLNMTAGVLLYRLFESIAGGLFVGLGVVVFLAWVGGAFTETVHYTR